ncbi:MAG: hypothetical protein CL483_14910 [Acidobacteria bacterium]|nr:hypothetical protein [Acidobacteriota bacterium]|tara:strand:- start:496 stop:1056 length:561 start_codon:yes stop_codon:yes gene_type:complete
MTGPIEREIKLAYASPDEARRAVMALGVIPRRQRRLQQDSLLDRGTDPLVDRRQTLRVRRDGDRAWLTFKGAPLPGPTKAREELETEVEDADRLLQLLARLGFEMRFRYEKYREEFDCGALVVTVDETPIGTFVELEGEEHDVIETAKRLGRSPADFILASYRELFLVFQAESGSTASHMRFDDLT